MTAKQSAQSLLADLSNRPVRKDLDPVREALKQLDQEPPETVVQVVGSNGKGSLVHYLSTALNALSRNVLSYTSPHFEHPAERYRYNGSTISEQQFERSLEAVDNDVTVELSPFEALFLVGVQLCAELDPEVLVLEAGMGGRWDATSASPADTTVLTSVELEHCSFLGHELADIAREQTAQIPRDTLLVSPEFQGEVADVVSRRVGERELNHREISSEKPVTEQLKTMAGIAAAELTGEDEAKAIQLLTDVDPPPGRGEILDYRGRQFLLDVAHTPDAVETVFEEKVTDPDGEIYTVFGCLEGKDVKAMLRRIRQSIPSDRLGLVEPPSDRRLTIDQMPSGIDYGSSLSGGSLSRAFEDMMEETDPGDLIVVLGSFDLVGWYRNRIGD